MYKVIFLSGINFASGFLIMLFEILGIRILGPHIGTSIIVWCMMIWIILFFLSLGNYHGGILADKGKKYAFMAKMFFITAYIFCCLSYFWNYIIFSLIEYFPNLWSYVFCISLLLFVPASYVLGMISPITMKLAIDDLNTSGSRVGLVSSMNSLWSIFWTLWAGFFLIFYFATSSILLWMGMISFFISIMLFFSVQFLKK